MITEDYVSFETAKLLKKKGFNEKCPCSYRKKLVDNKIVDEEELFVSANLMLTNTELENKAYRDIVYCSAPTLQMAKKWLRMEKDIQIEITIVGVEWESPTKWYYGFRCQNKEYIDRHDANFTSYEEAAEAAIKYCLENLI